MKRSGVADLPLHYGRVPTWLATRMVTLGIAIAESVVYHYGRPALLSRLSDPFWFQAFGAVLGMDWHSSGITTSVMGALKRGLDPRAHELGVYICGGRGRHSRNTPQELRQIAHRTGADGEALVRISQLTARIDNSAIADGFQIYLHSFVLTADGDWAIVQQGMNEATRLARRYHWHSRAVRDFTSDPHTAIVGERRGAVMNLVDRQARPAQDGSARRSRSPTSATSATSRRFSCSSSWVPGRSSRSLFAEVVHGTRRDLTTRPGFHSPSAARMATRFRFRYASMTSRSPYCAVRFGRRNWDVRTSWTACGGSTRLLAPSNRECSPSPTSRPQSPTNVGRNNFTCSADRAIVRPL